MAQVSFGVFSKRRNSTKQPTSLSDVRTVTLKEATSQDSPTFIVTGNNFNYNYCSWDGKYYFISDIESLRNNEIAVHCVLDPLATYKAEIIASTQYVAYSSLHGATWLPDTRIPITRNATVSRVDKNLDFPSTSGSYILTVVGKSGVDCFRVTRQTIQNIISGLQTWTDTLEAAADALITVDPTQNYSGISNTLATIGEAMVNSGFVGNSYQVAVQCIRSCHWVPFDGTIVGGSYQSIDLGEYPTGESGYKLSLSYTSGNVSISIPWQFSDWRRTYCENIYLYLPFVGQISLNVDDIVNEQSLVIKYSITPSDGQVCYEVSAGSQIVGTFGGNCAMQIPIGINQKSSLGDIVTTAFQGAEKTVAAATKTAESASSFNVGGVVGGFAQTEMSAIEGVYNTANVALSTNLTTLGGIGGGAGAGLSLQAACYSVARGTVCAPSDMVATMGQPTMKPVLLSTLSGYCECVNAHVEAPATAQELNAIDGMLNSGFYIE